MDEQQRRLSAIDALVQKVLDNDPAVSKDERHEPELRDVQQLARGHKPRTDVGKAVWKETNG